jgi:hypothetical protein
MSARKKPLRIGRLLVGSAPATTLCLAKASLTAADLVFFMC